MDNRVSKAEQWTQLIEKIRDIKFAMLTTENEMGYLHSRPMATLDANESGALWFFSSRASHKVREIEGNSRVNLAYIAGDKDTFVSVAGDAQLVEDGAKAKELWSPLMKAWFPQGLNDPDLILIRVDVDEAEYWDIGSKKMMTLIRFAKAVVGVGEGAREENSGHGVVRPGDGI